MAAISRLANQLTGDNQTNHLNGNMKNSSIMIYLLVFGMFADSLAAPPQVPITVKVQGDGIVTSEPTGINCPPSCTGSYEKSSAIILTATADINSSFLGWEGACDDTRPTCEVKLTSPAFALAVFGTATAANPSSTSKTGVFANWIADHYGIAGD